MRGNSIESGTISLIRWVFLSHRWWAVKEKIREKFQRKDVPGNVHMDTCPLELQEEAETMINHAIGRDELQPRRHEGDSRLPHGNSSEAWLSA